jgi:hypothetical protein
MARRLGMISVRRLQVSGATSPFCNALITWNSAMRLQGCELSMTDSGSIELNWLAHLGHRYSHVDTIVWAL